ncbi:MAG: YbaB/EbfC family nucleoid-associated protein [Candidatus Hydrogenedentes bacterium]|nr:YbaB/EbfC family nucleoid-associated protein [Candidatus Hydrogenedentota bacterium]
MAVHCDFRGETAILPVRRVLASHSVTHSNYRGYTVLPKGLGGLGDMAGMMKQAMAMKQRMEEFKESLADETVEASAGGGMVTVVVNGQMKVLSIKIDPEVINKDESEMLETLIRAAINDGMEKMQAFVKAKMSELTGGLNIPGLT